MYRIEYSEVFNNYYKISYDKNNPFCGVELFDDPISELDYMDITDEFGTEDMDITEQVESTCVICLSENDDNSIQLECQHEMHQSCLEQWKEARQNLRRIYNCPICRKPIKSPNGQIKDNNGQRITDEPSQLTLVSPSHIPQRSEPEGFQSCYAAPRRQRDQFIDGWLDSMLVPPYDMPESFE